MVSAAFLFLPRMFFLWNFDFSKTSFNSLGRSWGGGNFKKFTSLAGRGLLAFFPLLKVGTLVVNLFSMSLWNVLLFFVYSKLIPSTLEYGEYKVEGNLAKTFKKQDVFLFVVL